MTATGSCGTPERVSRTKVFPIRLTLPLTERMAKDLDAAKRPGEDRLAVIREAIEREIKRRSRTPSPKP